MNRMSREDVQFRDRLLLLAECSNPHKPFNVKRKSSLSKQTSGSKSGPKLSMQDFVRMDPGYTPDIEHLVFPVRKRKPQQVAPLNSAPSTSSPPGKTRSRLAEMFALSRHLQQRSTDREPKTSRIPTNRSVDSVLQSRLNNSAVVSSGNARSSTDASSARRWVSAAVEEPVRQNSTSTGYRISPTVEADMASVRGPNVSVLHLRSTSEPWETSPPNYQQPSRSSSYKSNAPPLTKHQSLGGYNKWSSSTTTSSFHSGGEVNSAEIFVTNSCNRELSPVRWCDREVDGVYLGRSGWVQVQQRSLDENRRGIYPTTSSLQSSKRTGIKLAAYHCNSEPGKCPEPVAKTDHRPAFLSLHTQPDFERKNAPSPQQEHSPPSITPIISPPPAFQDRNKKSTTKSFFSGKTHFLPRSNAIVDSDTSPPGSPIHWKTFLPPHQPIKPVAPPVEQPKPHTNRIPQTKSLEDTTSIRRTQFVQRYGEQSSSSSSSSMGFRSLDSCMNRPTRMPRLSENTDSSVDVYEDADEEDNNSSSINMNMSTFKLEIEKPKEKISPSGRSNRLLHHRNQIRRSPVGSDTNKTGTSPGSSSSSSTEFPSRFSSRGRTTPNSRQYQTKSPQEDNSRVKRSRSLQLPDKKAPGTTYRERISPQHMDPRTKTGQKQKTYEATFTDEDLIREAEVVTGFLYGNRSRAAAQALLLQRYNNHLDKEEKLLKEAAKNNEVTVYYVGNGKKDMRPKVLHRGATTPNLPTSNRNFKDDSKKPCNPESCDFWPHCAHREALNREGQFIMKSSQSYPTHQRSLDSGGSVRRPQERRPSPSRVEVTHDRKVSPINVSAGNAAVASNSSSNSDVWLTSDRTVVKVPRKPGIVGMLTEARSKDVIQSRPGSAPTEENDNEGGFLESQQRSMSLPKSFLSVNHQIGGQVAWRRRGTESLGSSPGLPRKLTNPSEISHTAPVTPLHEVSLRRRSPSGSGGTSSGGSGGSRRGKATSSPQLLEEPSPIVDNRKWLEKSDSSGKPCATYKSLPGAPAVPESVLNKFKKTFSLRFHQKKSSRDGTGGSVGGGSEIGGEALIPEISGEPSEDDSSPQHVPSVCSFSTNIDAKDDTSQQKTRFGPLIWRTSKERKKLNKAARNAKCNSGDSGIQIEMVPSCGGTGDSSPVDDIDSPPSIRRRIPQQHSKHSHSRPHSDLLNQILIDKFKSDLKQRSQKHNQVRRTRSDLGGQRIFHWDQRHLMSSPAPLIRGRLQSPLKKPPDLPEGVQLRNQYRRGQLRRSLSQPLDIDKLSPLMRTKTAGLRLGGSHVLSEDEHDCRQFLATSDDELVFHNSDSESSSVTSTFERKKSLELAMDEQMVILAEAVFDHVAIEAEELAFRAGDVIEVLETANRDWWWGCTAGKSGWFPAQFVRLRVSQEDTVEDCLAAMASGLSVPQIRRRTSISLLSNDQVRTSVVRELIHTERDFVKVLRDVAEGYIAECRKRTDMFSEEQIATMFINLEQILHFQTAFLKDMEARIDWEQPYKSCVGGCFLQHKDGFKMYSEYCNSHPMATASLQELYQFSNYSKFFEACRLMRGLIEIPLDGYLLTPVQRICKYPLQLAELLKYTRPDHPDYGQIKEALDVMRDVAMLINERKRRMESLEKLAAWQQRVEGWEGEDLIEASSQLIHQGDVVRVTTGMWTSNITLFLFDHQIVYCKKDILKRNTYVYKGRICLDTSEIIDVPDGKDNHVGVSVRHAIRLYSCIRDKWLLFCCRSSNDKQRWLRAFAEERKFVLQDKDNGLDFPPAARQLARMAARCQKRPPRKLKEKSFKRGPAYMGSTLQLNTNSNSLGRKMGTWFTFGANKKSRQQSRDTS